MEVVLALGQGAQKVHRVRGVIVLVDASHLVMSMWDKQVHKYVVSQRYFVQKSSEIVV
jgi:GTP cyclohydrolase I